MELTLSTKIGSLRGRVTASWECGWVIFGGWVLSSSDSTAGSALCAVDNWYTFSWPSNRFLGCLSLYRDGASSLVISNASSYEGHSMNSTASSTSLRFRDLTFCQMIMHPFHPLFWLENIDSLESCSLEMNLPPSPRSKYTQEFADLSSSELVMERARNQSTFNSLEIRLNVQSTDPLDVNHHVQPIGLRISKIAGNRFAENYNVLLRYLNRLYPNLIALTITIQDFCGPHDAITNGMCNKDIYRTNINLPFHSLQRLDVVPLVFIVEHWDGIVVDDAM